MPDESAEQLARSYGERLSQPWAEPPGESGPLAPRAAGDSRSESPTMPPPLARIVEALLFVGGPPLTADRAAEAAHGLTPPLLAQIVEGLNRDYRRQGRPYRIQPRDQGYELALRPRFRVVVERLYGSAREARLTPAALDVLALTAYRQPLGKNEIDSLRGAESGAALRRAGAAGPGGGAARRRGAAGSGLPDDAAVPERVWVAQSRRPSAHPGFA